MDERLVAFQDKMEKSLKNLDETEGKERPSDASAPVGLGHKELIQQHIFLPLPEDVALHRGVPHQRVFLEAAEGAAATAQRPLQAAQVPVKTVGKLPVRPVDFPPLVDPGCRVFAPDILDIVGGVDLGDPLRLTDG